MDAITFSIIKWEKGESNINANCGFCILSKIENKSLDSYCCICKIDKYICNVATGLTDILFSNEELKSMYSLSYKERIVKIFPVLQRNILFYLYNKLEKEKRRLKKHG